MTPFHIHLLGGFRVTPDDAGLPNLTRPRQQAFLAYLLLHCRRPQARQTIAATFWPESGDAQASKNLRVLLVEMRTAWPQIDHFVQIERTTLHWLPNPIVTVDLFAFEDALQRAAAHHPQATEQAVTALRTATALYTGDLLPQMATTAAPAAGRTIQNCAGPTGNATTGTGLFCRCDPGRPALTTL